MDNNVLNPFGDMDNPKTNIETGKEILANRQAQEVQAAMVIAKKFPRNQIESWQRIKQACMRIGLAEKAIYSYYRGSEIVSGASIRLAEVVAQNWGNIDFGIIELESNKECSQVMSYAWDLETNTRQCKIFNVSHTRFTKKGSYLVTDARDVYEMVASSGARRMRSCILGVIPPDIMESAMAQCNQTLLDGSGKIPLPDLVKTVADRFKEDCSIELKQLEEYIGYKSSAFTMQDLIKLKKIYNSLKDGMANREDFFKLDKPEEVSNPFKENSDNRKSKVKKENKEKGNEIGTGQLLLPTE